MAAKQKTESTAAMSTNAAAASAGLPASKASVSLLPAGPGLKLLVLTSGAVLMGLEIVGSRILAPYFGNSVFVWGSLISLFLIALSVGYYIGGGLSDRYPPPGSRAGRIGRNKRRVRRRSASDWCRGDRSDRRLRSAGV